MSDFNQLAPIKLVIVASKLYHTINDKLDKHIKHIDVNRSEFLVLHALASKGSAGIQAIGDMVHISSSTMTYTIDKLERRGLIKRVPSTEDRRIIHIEMTEAGKKLWDSTSMEHLEHLKDMLKEINLEELDEAIKLMKKIGLSIESYEE